LDECEDLLGHIEEKLGEPEATPSEIAAVVANLPSETVLGNRNLSDSLLRRLDEIAQHHGGNHVPLHGRLFAQWMHNVYPRECSYPHITGTTKPQRAEERMASQGQVSATKDEMRQHVASAPARQDKSNDTDGQEAGECGPWTMEEELVVSRPMVRARPATTIVRNIAFIVVAVSSMFGMIRTFGSALSSRPESTLPKYC